jgi:hypothetical protein
MGWRHSHLQVLALLAMILLVFGSTLAKADEASDDDLVKLARKHFNHDSIRSQQERDALDKFFLSVHQGKEADFVPEGSSEQDVSEGKSWGVERTIKAEWITWLCKMEMP